MTSQEFSSRESSKDVWQDGHRDNRSMQDVNTEGDGPTDADDQPLTGFIRAHSRSNASSPPKTPNCRLPSPVVIPQRRPGNKSRGFVEAYAPALEQFGIQQHEFLSFIRATNKAVQASKWLGAIQLAAAGTGFVPNHIALGVSVAVQIVAGVIAKAETRWKTNSLLDRVNEEYFQPRGLYCLLMAYKPITWGETTQFDVDEAVSGAKPSSSASQSTTKEQTLPARARRNLRNPEAGTIEGQENLPSNVAPLVYPDARDATSKTDKPATGRNAMTRIANYFDDRAQARYAKENTGDILTQPTPPSFKNRYLDPNHPATNGGLLGLISGGKLTPNSEKANERMQSSLRGYAEAAQEQQLATMDNLRKQLALMNLTPEQEESMIKQYEDAYQLQEQQLRQQEQLYNKGIGPVRKIYNVSYLMIVEIPSEEQIAKARRYLEASCGKQVDTDVSMGTLEI
ncbi:hypothetical protein F5Y16DRAFT_41407 [Xylariaceae sp. FL0255]|nr:hypothetical protein F5Y16DRAFT_41407 [Xylariaceae sp. FL0255]